jgi:hypothetical protein|tara:strand:- start:2367 stop:2711 length:345 start_codon:yes stop_codon:yes gene_type:complete
LSIYARGKYAFGFCDVTGFRYKLRDLVPLIRDGRDTGFRVGYDVLDKDNPQYELGRMNMSDPQALRNPRPDNAISASRRLGSFDPVGGGITELGSRTVGLDIAGEVGTVTVVIG